MKMYSLKANPLKTDTVTSSASQLVPENGLFCFHKLFYNFEMCACVLQMRGVGNDASVSDALLHGCCESVLSQSASRAARTVEAAAAPAPTTVNIIAHKSLFENAKQTPFLEIGVHSISV